jgi:hypothetical protein
MVLEQITDHADRALARLAMQHRGKTRTEALVRALAGSTQAVENVLAELLAERALSAAVGAQLDVLGVIVGVDRDGLEDNPFRVRINTRIRINRSSGTGNDILEVFRLVLPAGNGLELIEEFPAALRLVISNALPIYEEEAVALLRTTRAAGVRGLLQWSLAGTADAFTFPTFFTLLAADALTGATTLVVADPIPTSLPQTGTLCLQGESVGFAYTAHDETTFTLQTPLAADRFTGESVTLDAGEEGLGWADEAVAESGGVLDAVAE